MDAASTQYRVRVCSMCPGDAEYFCASCLCNLCLNCRENHVNNLKTIDHNVVIRKKYHYIPIQELCMTHPGKAYKKYCERCELPVCNKGIKLFRRPRCITENNNGDIVVSDWTAVVVTERGGRHRFTHNESQSIYNIFLPNEICTDALSHILVCEEFSNTVQMIDRDGQFLSYLLIRPSGIFYPRSLSYDVNTHRLWVGSEYYNKVCCFRYMTRKVACIGRCYDISIMFDVDLTLENACVCNEINKNAWMSCQVNTFNLNHLYW